eukprot:15516828-Heterocapsa_arctica.AAC.1
MLHGWVNVAIKEETITDVAGLFSGLLRSNVVSRKVLRALVGKLGHMASLVFMLRPFTCELWGALSEHGTSAETSAAPLNCIWRRQIDGALVWIN